jgi:acetyltransferase-like isoleucine patch superfamily enzyme
MASLPNPFDSGFYRTEELREFGFKWVGDNVQIAKTCTIVGLKNVSIGDNVRIDGFCTLVAAGAGFIEIGAYVHIAAYCSLSAGEGITLMDFSGLSQGVTVYTRSDDYSGEFLTNPTVPAAFTAVTRGAVVFGRHVIVGSGSTVLPGVQLGEGTAVGAHSLVTRSLGAWGIYYGAPAKRLRDRSRALLGKEATLLAFAGWPPTAAADDRT